MYVRRYLQTKLIRKFASITGLLILLCCPYLLIANENNNVSPPQAREGVLDLRKWDFDKKGGINLNQKWELYWKKLITPNDFDNNKTLKPTDYISPTIRWGQSTKIKERYGYATYRLTILLNNIKKPLTISLYPMTSFTLWINGEKIAATGKVEKAPSDNKVHIPYKIKTFHPNSKKLELVLQVSNFYNYRGGGGGSIILNDSSSFWLNRSFDLISMLLMIGAIMIMGVYHTVLWFQRRNKRSPILFAIFCFAVGLRICLIGDGFITTLAIPDLSLNILHRIEYLTMTTVVVIFPFFFRSLFPKDMPKSFAYINALIGAVYSSEIIAFSTHTFMSHLRFYQYIVLTVAVLSYFYVLKACFKRRVGSFYLGFGFTLIFIATINDVVMAMNLFDTIPLIGYASFVFLVVQSMVISKRFSEAFYNVERAEKEIRQLNTSLEAKVEERTREIAVILNNVKSGFFLIDRDLKIRKGSTKSCNQILKIDIKENMDIKTALRLSRRDADYMKFAIDQIFEDSLPEEASFKNLRKRYKIGSEIISMEGVTVRDDNGNVDSILFNIANISKLCAMEEETYKNKTLLHIVNHKDSFRSFLIDSKKRIFDIKKIIGPSTLNVVLTNLHTIKGNSASFGLMGIYHLIHSIEEKETIELGDANLIEDNFKGFLHNNFQTLGIDFEKIEEDSFNISESNLQNLGKSITAKKNQHEIMDAFRTWYHNATSKKATTLLGPIEKVIDSYASKAGKKIQLSITGGDVKLNQKRMGTVFNSIIHLIRNSIDHGIEKSNERGDKPEKGNINIKFIDDPASYLIIVSDDGAGINKKQVIDKAVEAGLINSTEIESLSNDEILDLIFHPQLSTTKQVTEISGRGVGLTALMKSVTDLGGEVSVESESSVGTKFTIAIPKYSKLKKVAS